MAAAFTVGDNVWFKSEGSTPFVTGDASDAATVVGAELGGRGKAAISRSSAAQSGLSDAQGVPTIDFTEFPNPLTSTDSAEDTSPAAGELLGVREQITGNNPLAPGSVSTAGKFDGPTSDNLFNPGDDNQGSPIDEGNVDNDGDNTIRDIDPNFPSGRSTAAVASGIGINVGGTQDFVKETIDLQTAAKRVGRRLPSSEEGAGTVVQVVTVKNAGVTPDGTKVRAGDFLYWVDWGTSNAGNPHNAKWYNRMRTTLHAEADLVAA